MLKIDSENRLDHVLEALENPSAFTSEELKQLFSDEECLNNARAILAAREALARRHVPAPDVNEEWKALQIVTEKIGNSIGCQSYCCSLCSAGFYYK